MAREVIWADYMHEIFKKGKKSAYTYFELCSAMWLKLRINSDRYAKCRQMSENSSQNISNI